MKSRLLATVTAALVLVTASACANPGSAGQTMEKMTPTPSAMGQAGAMSKGDTMPDATMTKTETMKTDGAMMADSDAMMKKEARPKEGVLPEGGAVMTPPESVVKGESMTKDDAMTKDGPGMMEPEGGAETESAIEPQHRYVTYSPGALASALQHGRAVLFFRAAWCPTCRAADAAFKANLEKIPGDVTILAVNYDRESALKRQHNITYQHTFVQVDGSGKQVSRWSGGDVRELLANLQ